MFVNTEQIQRGVNSFIDNELGKKAVGVNKFAVYFLLPLINSKIAKMVNAYAQNELTREMFDENNNINLDTLYAMGKDAIRKSGQFVYSGIVFTETDIDKLYTYIKNQGELV